MVNRTRKSIWEVACFLPKGTSDYSCGGFYLHPTSSEGKVAPIMDMTISSGSQGVRGQTPREVFQREEPCQLHWEGDLILYVEPDLLLGRETKDTWLQEPFLSTLQSGAHLSPPSWTWHLMTVQGPTPLLPAEHSIAVIRASSTHTVTNTDEEKKMYRNLDILSVATE